MSKYIPPNMRNKQTSEPVAQHHSRPSDRRQRRHYQKPLWEIEKEQAEAAAAEERKKQEAGLENSEDNFPSLGQPAKSMRVWGGERSFADLAQEWSAKAETEKIEGEMKSEVTDNTDFSLPRFRNVHRFHEPEDVTVAATEEVPADEWQRVERRVYTKKKTVMDYTENDFEKEGEETNQETVWGDAPNEYETCWDEKKY